MGQGHSDSEQANPESHDQHPKMKPANFHENAAGDSNPRKLSTFHVGVSEDRNQGWRNTMEDTHSYVYDFQGVRYANSATDDSVKASSPVIEHVYAETDNGYAAIFDGHAGSASAEWCGKNVHVILQRLMEENPTTNIPILLDRAFTEADDTMKDLGMYSGCTAVVGVLRWEDRIGPITPAVDADDATKAKHDEGKNAAGEHVSKSRQRILYTANVGDARAVLCRDGKALRLSYDHKASDANERKRINDAGGLVVGNRVNGVLAVTRALGDSYLKPFVTGHPFTTETQIQPDTDEFLILACDGLWDVCTDENAVALIRDLAHDPQEASRKLVEYAKTHNSNDNLSCMVVHFQSEKMKNVLHGGSIPARLPPLKESGQVPSSPELAPVHQNIHHERNKFGHIEKPDVHDCVADVPIDKLSISSPESSPNKPLPAKEAEAETEPGPESKSKSKLKSGPSAGKEASSSSSKGG